MLGGDQVYPSASVEAYEDHFLGPFAAALWSPDEAAAPDLWAVPGNHDWYDGLTSFLRVFCRKGGWVGGWRTKQKCSYFALRLPHNWWLWAIDIQFDTYLDTKQLDYFEGVGAELGEQDRVVLVTAKPSWVRAEARRGRARVVALPVVLRGEVREGHRRDARGHAHRRPSPLQPLRARLPAAEPVAHHGGRRRRLPVAHAHAAGQAAAAFA